MQKVQFSGRRRLTAVRHNYKKFEDEVGDNPALSGLMGELDVIHTSVEDILRKQIEGSKHVTAFKTRKGKDMIKTINKVQARLSTIARESGRTDLEVLVTRGKTKIKRMTAEGLLSYAQSLEREVEGYTDVLDRRGFSYDRQAEFSAQIADYRDWMDAPRDTIAARSAGTLSLPDLLARASHIINFELEGLMLDYENDLPSFYNGYLASRILVDLGYRRRKSSDAGDDTTGVDASTGK